MIGNFIFSLLIVMSVSLSAHADFIIEAENAQRIVAPFKVLVNSTASNGKVVVKPKGTAGRGLAVFNLNIPASAVYTLRAQVYAPSSSANSFLVQVNSGSKVRWQLPISDVWQIAKFQNDLSLKAGAQTLTIYSDDPDTGLDRIELIQKSVTPTPNPSPTPAPTPTPTPTPSPAPVSSLDTRALWVWTTHTVLTNSAEGDNLVALSQSSKITDIFFYLVAADYRTYAAQIRSLNSRLNSLGIHAWGLEGYRGYFNDCGGPQGLYDAAQALIDFNSGGAAQERFYGFHSDMEPQDGQTTECPSSFHNGFADSQLNSAQAVDRETLMRDWLSIHSALSAKVRGAGLKLGAAMPSWTDDYYGEEVKVTYNGIRQGVMKSMMPILDDYVVMSYNTDPSNAANRLVEELTYADSMSSSVRPRVFAAVETHRGPGPTVSYGDSATKNSRKAVLSDIETIKSLLSKFVSFRGVDIHDWEGWRDLTP